VKFEGMAIWMDDECQCSEMIRSDVNAHLNEKSHAPTGEEVRFSDEMKT
jgi:hypothetical protein